MTLTLLFCLVYWWKLFCCCVVVWLHMWSRRPEHVLPQTASPLKWFYRPVCPALSLKEAGPRSAAACNRRAGRCGSQGEIWWAFALEKLPCRGVMWDRKSEIGLYTLVLWSERELRYSENMHNHFQFTSWKDLTDSQNSHSAVPPESIVNIMKYASMNSNRCHAKLLKSRLKKVIIKTSCHWLILSI